MRWKWRRSWPVAALTFAALAVVVIHLVVDSITRELPNYSRIEEGLWLGGYVREPPKKTQAVLNLCETEDLYRAESHKWEPIRDAAPAPNLDWLREQVVYIETQRNAGRIVYVHCRNGVSRSGMVLAAYLMRRDSLSRDQALELLRIRRPGVRPHQAFMQLLLEWEISLKR